MKRSLELGAKVSLNNVISDVKTSKESAYGVKTTSNKMPSICWWIFRDPSGTTEIIKVTFVCGFNNTAQYILVEVCRASRRSYIRADK